MGGPATLLPGDRVIYCAEPASGAIAYFEAWPDLSGTICAKYVGAVTTRTGTTIYVSRNGQMETYQSTAAPGFQYGDYVRLTLNSHGAVTAVAPVAWLGGERDYRIVAVSDKYVTVAYVDGTTKYALFDLTNADLYRAADGAAFAAADLRQGMLLRVVTIDGSDAGQVALVLVTAVAE